MLSVAVTDRKQCREPFLERIGRICAAGPDLLVLREKDLSVDAYAALAADVKKVCDGYGTLLCINTFTDVARSLGVDRVWVPYRDFMERPSTDLWTMVSVHSVEEAVEACGKGADAVVFGNVFETTCKPGKAARGTEVLREIRERTGAAVYAIGGISPDNLEEVSRAGAVGACMMSGFMTSDDLEGLVSAFRRV
ncbi:MAG: thiamine phosphate synthase [archaeon]|nr:thiamine phosphate synthase [archaeon]